MSDEKPWTCRICMKPCRYLIIDKTGYALLPGYCDEHGASMLRPMENSVVTASAPMPSAAKCGAYLGDNDGTCPQLTCIRDKGHEGAHDNVCGDGEAGPVSPEARAAECPWCHGVLTCGSCGQTPDAEAGPSSSPAETLRRGVSILLADHVYDYGGKIVTVARVTLECIASDGTRFTIDGDSVRPMPATPFTSHTSEKKP